MRRHPGSTWAGDNEILDPRSGAPDGYRYHHGRQNVSAAIDLARSLYPHPRRIVLVANGKSKAATVAAAFEGPVSCMCTASALQLHGDSRIFLDESAASNLKMREYYDWVCKMKAKAPK